MKKIISLILCFCLILGTFPGILAAEEKTYLALGDSITAGTRLEEGQAAFPQIIAQNGGYLLNNQGVNGLTADVMYEALAGGALDGDIARADLITITCGGNDLLDLLYEVVTASYNATYSPAIVPDDVVLIMADSADPRYMSLLFTTMSIMIGDGTPENPPFAQRADFLAEVELFISNLNRVTDYIRAINPEVPLLVPTQYNPYRFFSGLYGQVNITMDEAVRVLNNAIVANAERGTYLVADVFQAFQTNPDNLCNAVMDPMDLDFHPNAAGHAVMAQVFQDVIDQLPQEEPGVTDPSEPEETEPSVPSEPEETDPSVPTEPEETEPSVPTEPEETEPSVPTEPEETEPTVPSEPEETEPTVPSEPEETEPIAPTEPEETEPSEPAEPVVNPFTDIKETDYFYESVLWALEQQVTNGVTADRFGPGQNCTRGQVVTFLWRAMGQPEPVSTENPFTDVSEGDYFYKAVLWAAENNITNGVTSDRFGPSGTCTRGQVVTFLWRTAGCPAPESAENPFADVAADTYYTSAVLWAVEQKITLGVSAASFAPGNTCTRGQVVTFLCRALKDQ